MSAHIAAACYREIGAELRKYREAAGLSHVAIAPDFGCSPSKISRIETGHAPISEVDVIHYLGLCGVYIPEARPLMEMCRIAERHMGYWLDPHVAGLNDSARAFIFHESTARASIVYEPDFVYGLLQTEDYIRALTAERWPDWDLEFAVRTRQERQRILQRPKPAQFTFYLHESALRLTVGNPTIMHEQMLWLLLLDGSRHVKIRVIPASAGAQAMFGGAFVLFEYADHRPLVYLDGYFNGLFLEDSEYVEDYRKLVPTIAEVALDGRQSREYLAALASAYDRERADADAHPGVEEK